MKKLKPKTDLLRRTNEPVPVNSQCLLTSYYRRHYYYLDTQTRIHPTDCFTWTTEVAGKRQQVNSESSVEY